MRAEPNIRIEEYRRYHPLLGTGDPGKNYGFFVFGPLRIISSGCADSYTDWEHVSVSCANRCPNWQEMDLVKRLFWDDDETVIQFHPRRDEYVNTHEFTLHLWKHRDGHVLPPQENV
jgi:hypothetical protein